ncbi:MAG: sugar phosphorylase [Deinococcota bacterium]
MSVSEATRETLQEQLEFIYGNHQVLADLINLIETTQQQHPKLSDVQAGMTANDVVLISYGDSLNRNGEAPLNTLHAFVRDRLQDAVNIVHLLPFFPYTSDDGFSVVDYLEVDPAIGTWQDISKFAADTDLMFDAVINHVSAASHYVQGYLADDPNFAEFCIDVDPTADTSMIVRPRTTPLLTSFESESGTRHLWTTFSADQVDLNYENPKVLLEVVRVLLEYAAYGARIIRLDAVTYLWKELGHPSVHHPKTHAILQLARTVLEAAAPGVLVLTETNVPHAENISYFGDGTNEAHMVYNFALPPLVLHTLVTGNAEVLTAWASDLQTSDQTCFFNFLSSHDGIGVRPVEGLLSSAEVQNLVDTVLAHGGHVSFKTNSDGSTSPYELNITYFDALNNPKSEVLLAEQVARFCVAHAIMMSLAGMPAIYIHSLLGSRSDHVGVEATGRYRSINREKLSVDAVLNELDDISSLRSQVLTSLSTLLKIRREHPTFHPQAVQQILAISPQVFALVRGQGDRQVVCLHNISSQQVSVSWKALNLEPTHVHNLLGEVHQIDDDLLLKPYDVCWLSTNPTP